MQILEKLPQILGLCPVVKFRSTLEKSDPQTFGGPLSTEKSCINYCILTLDLQINLLSILGVAKYFRSAHETRDFKNIQYNPTFEGVWKNWNGF